MREARARPAEGASSRAALHRVVKWEPPASPAESSVTELARKLRRQRSLRGASEAHRVPRQIQGALRDLR